jgi:GT2 family glycosyltransferase
MSSVALRVSVVVPTYRRPDLLARCLSSLTSQGFDPAAYEVIIADDAADERTCQQVCELAARVKAGFVYAPVVGSHGPAAARNVGWRQARAPIIAFTDDDCIPDSRWLTAGVRALENAPQLAAVSGQIIVPLPEQPTDYERDTAGLASAEFVTANCFCRRSALKAIGGFDERFRAAWREDSDLQFTLLEEGYLLGKAPDAVVVHPARPASWGVSLRQQRKVLFDALLYRKHPTLYRRWIRRRPRWDYYVIVAVLVIAGILAAAGNWLPACGALGLWAWLTSQFAAARLRGTTHRPGHIAEMVATSALIPALACFWRFYGAVKFRTLFL